MGDAAEHAFEFFYHCSVALVLVFWSEGMNVAEAWECDWGHDSCRVELHCAGT